jgi:hypothetical protein
MTGVDMDGTALGMKDGEIGQERPRGNEKK